MHRCPERTQVLDGGADVSRVDLVTALDRVRRVPGGPEGHRNLVVDVPAERVLDQVAGVRQRSCRVFRHRLLELRPASLPLVQVETGLVHAHAPLHAPGART